MMPGNFDMSAVPAGYATPDQIQQGNLLSTQLNKGAHRDAPITSPWQGARMMADALTGQKNMQHNSAQEMASRAYDNPDSMQGPWSQQQNAAQPPQGAGAPGHAPGTGMLGQQPPPTTAMPPAPMAPPPPVGAAPGGPMQPTPGMPPRPPMPMPPPRPPMAPQGPQPPPNMAGMPPGMMG